MIQYIAVPATGGGYTLYNTHSRIFTMVETDTDVASATGGYTYKDVSRHISQHDIATSGTLANAATNTVLAIVNKNGHVTPICDPTP